MPHEITLASTGRSKCRGCKTSIEKGALRFGEEVPNAFGDGRAVHWYHLRCGARRRPESFFEALESFTEEGIDPEERIAFEDLCRWGRDFPRLSRFVQVHAAPSGRARCQGCRELIEKGELRFVLERVEDGMVAGAGFVHVACAHQYAGAAHGILERVRAQSELSEEQWQEVEGAIAQQIDLPLRPLEPVPTE